MPFKSVKQQDSCYATGGWKGNVNCQEWSAKTNQKYLPKKVKSKNKK